MDLWLGAAKDIVMKRLCLVMELSHFLCRLSSNFLWYKYEFNNTYSYNSWYVYIKYPGIVLKHQYPERNPYLHKKRNDSLSDVWGPSRYSLMAKVPLNRRLEKHRTRCFTHEPGGSLLRKPFPQAGKKRISYIPIKHNQVWELDEHPLFSKKCATTKKEMDFNATIVGIGTGNLSWAELLFLRIGVKKSPGRASWFFRRYFQWFTTSLSSLSTGASWEIISRT